METISLTELQLDLDPTPVGGWDVYLAGLGIAVIEDDIGRRAIARNDARRLLAEHRASVAREQERLRRHREKAERQAVERDQAFRAQLHPGLPASMFAPGEDPIRVQIAAELAADPRRRSLREELMDAQFGRSADDEKAYTYYPIREEADDGS